MDCAFELHIALRYLLAKRKQAFISVISFISTLGVTVGVMALVIALALMTGPARRSSATAFVGSNPHIFVWKRGGIGDYRTQSTRFDASPRDRAAPAIVGRPCLGGGRPGVHQPEGIDLRRARVP
jgi:lipoprotein-releasing system permease protein